MSAQNGGVSLYRPYIPDTPIHLAKADTPGDTHADTPSLKSLALNYLSKKKPIHPAIQTPIHPAKKCITGEGGSDTLLKAENGVIHGPDKGQKIDLQIFHTPLSTDEPTPEQIAHARRMLVDCPSTGGKLHCWHCSRCDDARTCTAWRSRRADVERFRNSGEPYSLYLVEEVPGVLQ